MSMDDLLRDSSTIRGVRWWRLRRSLV